MKAVLAGLGGFGFNWYIRLRRDHPDIALAVAEPDSARRERATDARGYADLGEALDCERPDFLINVTPPGVHLDACRAAFERRIPVLCEKPIADSYARAVELVELSRQSGVPLAIAENYRREPIMRQVRAIIESGRIGRPMAMDCRLYRNFRTSKPYFLAMPHALLADVVVHIIDLARYFAGEEIRQVYARNFNPPTRPWTCHVGLVLNLVTIGGMIFNFSGSLGVTGAETPFHGDWRIDGTDGVILKNNETIELTTGGAEKLASAKTEAITEFNAANRGDCVDDFLRFLKEGIRPETMADDYLRNEEIVHLAGESDRFGRTLTVGEAI